MIAVDLYLNDRAYDRGTAWTSTTFTHPGVAAAYAADCRLAGWIAVERPATLAETLAYRTEQALRAERARRRDREAGGQLRARFLPRPVARLFLGRRP